jgi:hypothetical protein
MGSFGDIWLALNVVSEIPLRIERDNAEDLPSSEQ